MARKKYEKLDYQTASITNEGGQHFSVSAVQNVDLTWSVLFSRDGRMLTSVFRPVSFSIAELGCISRLTSSISGAYRG